MYYDVLLRVSYPHSSSSFPCRSGSRLIIWSRETDSAVPSIASQLDHSPQQDNTQAEFFKEKSEHTPRPSEHPPVMEEKMSKLNYLRRLLTTGPPAFRDGVHLLFITYTVNRQSGQSQVYQVTTQLLCVPMSFTAEGPPRHRAAATGCCLFSFQALIPWTNYYAIRFFSHTHCCCNIDTTVVGMCSTFS